MHGKGRFYKGQSCAVVLSCRKEARRPAKQWPLFADLSLGCCLAFILPHLWYLENNMLKLAAEPLNPKSRVAQANTGHKFPVTKRCAVKVRQSLVPAKLFM